MSGPSASVDLLVGTSSWPPSGLPSRLLVSQTLCNGEGELVFFSSHFAASRLLLPSTTCSSTTLPASLLTFPAWILGHSCPFLSTWLPVKPHPHKVHHHLG